MAQGLFIFKVYDGVRLIYNFEGSNALSSHFPNIAAGLVAKRVYDTVSYFKIGSDNTPLATPSDLLADITGGNKNIDAKEIWGGTFAQFNLIVETNEFNGEQIGEFGLYTLGNRLVARMVLPQVLIKTASVRYDILWRIEFF